MLKAESNGNARCAASAEGHETAVQLLLENGCTHQRSGYSLRNARGSLRVIFPSLQTVTLLVGSISHLPLLRAGR
jgi:hypothetical protein